MEFKTMIQMVQTFNLRFLVDLGVKESQLVDLKSIVAKQDELYKMIGTIAKSSTMTNKAVKASG